MKKKGVLGPAVSWRRMRSKQTSAAFHGAYSERRLELEVAAMIHTLRRKRGLSQRELARLTGTRQSAIARLEGGGENVTIARLQKIASVLNAHVRIEMKAS